MLTESFSGTAIGLTGEDEIFFILIISKKPSLIHGRRCFPVFYSNNMLI